MNPVHPLRRISAFLFLSLFAYGVLVVPWPGVMNAYRMNAYQAFFCAGGNAIFGTFGDARITFRPIASESRAKDITIRIEKRRRRSGNIDMTTLFVGYRPTVFMIALVVATPLVWRRRLRALLWSLLWVNAFIVLRVGIYLVDVLSSETFAVLSIGPFGRSLLGTLRQVLFDAPASIYTVPAFIWLLVSFRRGDLHRILGSTARPTHAPTKPTR